MTDPTSDSPGEVINLTMMWGAWNISRDGTRTWVHNPNLSMSRDEQYRQNIANGWLEAPAGPSAARAESCEGCNGCPEVLRLRGLLAASEATNRALVAGGHSIQKAVDAIDNYLHRRLQRLAADQSHAGVEHRAAGAPP